MSIKITCPKNDTNIQLNVSGKSVKEVALELGTLGWILKTITETDDSFKDGFAFKEEDGEYPRPLPRLNYREWDDDDEFVFSSNSIIRGYAIEDDVVNVQVDPTFMEWARTDKPMDEYCKAQQAELEAHIADTPQTERSDNADHIE